MSKGQLTALLLGLMLFATIDGCRINNLNDRVQKLERAQSEGTGA